MHSDRISKLAVGVFGVVTTLVTASVQAHTLHDVVQYTVKTNPEVLRSAKLKHATRQQVDQARADYYPRLDLHAGVGREKAYNNNTKSYRGDHLTSWRRQLGLVLRQNIFRGFQTYYEVKRTTAKTDADSYKVCATAEDLALQATDAYYNVLRFKRQVSVGQDNLKEHRGIFDMIKKRGESGVGREADISQATGRLALAKSNLYALENDYKNAKVTFQRVTGMEGHGLSMPADPSKSVLPTSSENAVHLALKYHPKMRIAVVDVEELRAQHNVSHYTAFPSLDLVLEANKDQNINGSRGRNDSYVAALELNYNLFNGGADVARQRETAYLTQEAAEVRNRTCREVSENVRLAWNNMMTARTRLSALKQHKDSAAKTRSAYDEQFRIGKRTLFDLLDSQNEKFTSELAYVNGIYDLYLAEYRVLHAIGGLNSFLRVHIPEAAHAQFDIYAESANPINISRHWDARLWACDKPSVWYNTEKKHGEAMSGCHSCTNHPIHRKGYHKMAAVKGPHNQVAQTSSTAKDKHTTQLAKTEAATTQPVQFKPGYASESNHKIVATNSFHHLTGSPVHDFPVAHSVTNDQKSASNASQAKSTLTSAKVASTSQSANQPMYYHGKRIQRGSAQYQAAQAEMQAAAAKRAAIVARNKAESVQQTVPVTTKHSNRPVTHVNKRAQAFVDQAQPRTAHDHASFAKTASNNSTSLNHDANQRHLARSPEHSVAHNVTTKTFQPKNNAWAVEIGSFEDQDEVDELVTTLRNYGLNGFLKEIRTPTSITFEVYVGPAKQKSEAVALMTKLQKLNIKGTIVRAGTA